MVTPKKSISQPLAIAYAVELPYCALTKAGIEHSSTTCFSGVLPEVGATIPPPEAKNTHFGQGTTTR
jgi:hypothetical protein